MYLCTTILLYPLPTVPDAPRNVFTRLTYHKSDGDDPGQLAHIALDWTPVVRISKFWLTKGSKQAPHCIFNA